MTHKRRRKRKKFIIDRPRLPYLDQLEALSCWTKINNDINHSYYDIKMPKKNIPTLKEYFDLFNFDCFIN